MQNQGKSVLGRENLPVQRPCGGSKLVVVFEEQKKGTMTAAE